MVCTAGERVTSVMTVVKMLTTMESSSRESCNVGEQTSNLVSVEWGIGCQERVTKGYDD